LNLDISQNLDVRRRERKIAALKWKLKALAMFERGRRLMPKQN